jgi:glycosyltransferase involved in cell wall biosynthesis
MTSPLISVLLPVRNGERFLPAALDSLAAQTFGDFEAILVDDGSTDGTPALLAAAAARDPRFRVERGPGEGVAAALARAIAPAQGRYLARLDADDLARPERFARQLAYLEAHPKLVVLGTGYEEIDEQGAVLRRQRMPTEPAEVRAILPRTNCIAHPTVMMRREAVAQVGGYRRTFEGAEDYDLWLRLLEIGELANLAEPLLGYRRHGTAAMLRRARLSALAELGARAAYRRRERGLPELLDETRPLDREALRRMGLSEAAIDRHLVKRFMAAARDAARAGARAEALGLVEEGAKALGPRAGAWARLDFLWRRRKVWR